MPVVTMEERVRQGMQLLEALDKKGMNQQETSEAFLLKLLRDNQDTEYGKMYGFADIHSIAEYQRKVPVTMFDDYAGAVHRMTENGEENLLTAYPVHWYARTSGTMGNPKRIPLSIRGMENAYQYMYIVYFGEMGKHFGTEWTKQKGLNLLSYPESFRILPSGAEYGSISGLTYYSMKESLPILYVSPEEAVHPAVGVSGKYLHALYALRYENLSHIQCSFFSFLEDFFRYIEKHQETLITDIAEGTINDQAGLDPETKARLEKELSPDPERAEKLRKILGETRNGFSASKVWPSLRFIMGIGTGSFQQFAEKIRLKYTGSDVPFLFVGLVSSEGVYSYAYGLDREDSVLVPDGVFLEFLPLEAENDFSKIVTMDQLELGKDYELIITNLSGLYRYRLRDVIRVTGEFQGRPTIRFMGRLEAAVSIMGEKTTELALTESVRKTAEILGLDIVDYSVYPDTNADPMRYVYFLEIASNPEDVTPREIHRTLEMQLALANPSMGEKMKSGLCGHIRVNFLGEDSYALYRDVLYYKGGNAGQVKPVHIIQNEAQRKFFAGTTRYSYDAW